MEKDKFLKNKLTRLLLKKIWLIFKLQLKLGLTSKPCSKILPLDYRKEVINKNKLLNQQILRQQNLRLKIRKFKVLDILVNAEVRLLFLEDFFQIFISL